jgi:hypothetical protein
MARISFTRTMVHARPENWQKQRGEHPDRRQALIDRLEKAGCAKRKADPQD